jgi:serine protease inhibitor
VQRASSNTNIAVCGLLLALGLDGCGGEGTNVQQTPLSPATTTSGFAQATAVQEAQKADTPVNPTLVSADDAVGLELLNLLNQHTSPNVSISPISIVLALQMLYNGAAGTTQQAMAQALQLQGLSAPEVNEDNAALQASLINPDPVVQLTIANSLWMHLSSNAVLPSFTQANQTYYAAQVGDLAGAPAAVNEWVANATGGLITQILPADFNPDLTVAVIANAVYFKAAWSTAFDPAQTTAAPFTRADGTQVSCQMMHQTGTYEYFQTQNVQVIRLPYGQNNRMSMLVVLPAPGVTLDAMVAALTVTELDSWVAQMSSVQLSVGLPRFTTSYRTSLVGPLTTLGMGVAFSPTEANLSALAPKTYVSFVQHATVVQVDETGTVAAGATGIGIITIAPLTMTLDHPFLYAIRDDKTGALLFIGLMFDPTSP